jgi:hypothetical protein
LAYFGRGSSPFLFVFDFLGFSLTSLFISPLFISLGEAKARQGLKIYTYGSTMVANVAASMVSKG